MLHLNPQVQQYDGFTPRRRVFGERLKCRLVPSVIRFLRFREPEGFTGHTDAPSDGETAGGPKSLSRKRYTMEVQRIVKSSDSRNRNRRNLVTAHCLFLSENGKNKADFKLHGHCVINGGFGRKGDLVYYRRNSTEVDLNDPMSENKIPRCLMLRRGVTFAFNGWGFPIRYLVGPQNVSFLDENSKWAFAE